MMGIWPDQLRLGDLQALNTGQACDCAVEVGVASSAPGSPGYRAERLRRASEKGLEYVHRAVVSR